MTRQFFFRGRHSILALGLALVSCGLSGQTTWTGAVSSSWNVSGNWSGGVPNLGFDAVIPSGTPNAPSTAGVANAACRDLTVALGATLTIAVGSPLDVGRNMSMGGSISGSGLLRLPGASNCSLTGGGTIGANVEILKSSGTQVTLDGNVAVNGNLTQTSGSFLVAGVFSPFTMTVSGNAQFQGGLLTLFFTGVLDVAGNVTFSGTSVTGSLPTIRCGGNWTSDAAFAPTSGTLVFDGNGTQSVSSAGVLSGVTVEAASSITTSAALVMNGSLAVNGSFTHQGGALTVHGAMSVNGAANVSTITLDLNGSLTVGASGSIAFGGGTHTLQSLTVTGGLTATGTLVLDGATNGPLASSAPLPNLQVSKSAGSLLHLDSNVTVNGNLTQTSGTFQVAGSNAPFTIAVSGNAQFQGGALSQFFAGVIDVAGNVTFSGTSVTSALPTIRCGGNWISDAAFTPTSGTLVFDGNGVQSVSSAGVLPGLTVEATSSITTSAALVVNGSITVNGSFTHQGGLVTVNGALSVNGTANVSTGTLDLNGTLTVGASGSIAFGGGTHTLQSLAVTGGLTATGTLVLDGATNGSLASSAPLPNLQVSKSAGSLLHLDSNVTVNGDLTQTSGTFQVAGFNAPFTIAVSGNAQFQGGALSQFFAGVIDVAGNVTFSGTSVTSALPTIRCGGNWTSDAAFTPTSGTLVFDGSGVQSVSSAGMLPGLTVEATSSITTSAALVVNGSITVNGSFTHQGGLVTVNGALSVNGTANVSTGTLDLNGTLTVGASGSIAFGGGTHTLQSLTVTGGLTATGTLVLDGATPGSIASSAPLPNLQVSKSAGAMLQLDSNVTVNGNLTQTSGTFQVAGSNAPFTIAVSGNAQFQGGALSQFFAGVIDVAGNVTFSGTTMQGSPTIRCAGNWVSDAAFATGGTVELDGAAATTIAHAVAGGTLSVATLVISNGTRTMVNDFTIASATMTIAPTGALAISGGRHLRVHNASGATGVNVNGGLSVAANGELSMGPQTAATVGASGLLTIIGTAAQPAKITGEAGGGYGLSVFGSLAAKDFLVKEMGPGGMLVDASATLAAAPNNLRSGTFDFRTGAPAGSVLLDLRRQAPSPDFDGLVFLNTPAAAGVFNVTTHASSVPISFTNWTGAFAGPTFENDPNNLIAWNLQAGPSVAFFVVVPGAELAEIVWHTTSDLNVTGYEVRRATSAAGPFSTFVTTPNTGHTYGFVDSPLPANQAVFYAGYAVMSGGDILLIGSGSTTPYSSATPGNVKKVGGNGAFTTIQAAINAATDPNSIVWVTPGTYAAFTIGATATPSNLRILGDGPGPVNIDTSGGPIQIMNVAATSGVELSNLVVGSPTTGQDGIVVTNCLAPLVLDELTVACDGAHTAITVSGSPSAAIQRSNVQGGTGLLVSSASYVAISRGSLSSLVSTGSTIELSTLTPGSVNVTPAASLIARTSLMPNINLPEFIPLSLPSALFLNAQPNAPFIIGASPRLGFQTGGFQMPFLLDPDPAGLAQLPMMSTDGLGDAVVGFEISPIAALLGFSFTVQVVVGDPGTGASLLSNVESMVCIP